MTAKRRHRVIERARKKLSVHYEKNYRKVPVIGVFAFAKIFGDLVK